ncbi:MAG: hypothetical protein U0531_13830 [Dehalococcoidia bacterium]
MAPFERYCERGHLGTVAVPCGLMVYDRDLTRDGDCCVSSAADLALDAGGREMLVFQDVDEDALSILDLETGKVTALWPIDFSHTAIGFHLSGRATRRRAGRSSRRTTPTRPRTWMDDQVFAMELRPNGHRATGAHARASKSGRGPGARLLGRAARDGKPGLHPRAVHHQLESRSGTEVETFMLLLQVRAVGEISRFPVQRSTASAGVNAVPRRRRRRGGQSRSRTDGRARRVASASAASRRTRPPAAGGSPIRPADWPA